MTDDLPDHLDRDDLDRDDLDRDDLDLDELVCDACGADMFINAAGVSHHWGDGPDDVDHDADADHVAVCADAD